MSLEQVVHEGSEAVLSDSQSCAHGFVGILGSLVGSLPLQRIDTHSVQQDWRLHANLDLLGSDRILLSHQICDKHLHQHDRLDFPERS